MIIRSQDKTKIFNFEQIRKIDCGNGMIIADSVSLLGEYATEEKAIKVLDMICEKYKEPIVRANYTNEESLIYANSVFQMPQDSKV